MPKRSADTDARHVISISPRARMRQHLLRAAALSSLCSSTLNAGILFLDSFGAAGASNGQFAQPGGITVAPDGSLYVTDTGNDRIQHFDAAGNYLGKFGSPGSGNGQFVFPNGVVVGLTVNSAGEIYVADRGSNRIQRFAADGTFINRWGGIGTGNGQFSSPADITCDGTNVYVADLNNHRIQKFSAVGSYLDQFGSIGGGDGKLNQPSGIAVTAGGDFLIADTLNQRIDRFHSNLTFQFKIGSFGSADGQFNRPAGVALDAMENIYVADEANNRIEKFSSSGSFLQSFGTLGSADGQMTRPLGVAATSSGLVYVVDTDNNRIHRWLDFDAWVSPAIHKTPSLTLTTTATLDSGKGLDVHGDLTLPAAGVLNLIGGSITVTGKYSSAGTLVMTSGTLSADTIINSANNQLFGGTLSATTLFTNASPLTITGGTLNAGSFVNNSTLNLTAGTLNVGSFVRNGPFNWAGGTLRFSDALVLDGPKSTIIFGGSSSATLSAGQQLAVANDLNLQIDNLSIVGGSLVSGKGFVGYKSDAIGTVLLSGHDSTWTARGLNLGWNGPASLTILDQSVVTNSADATLSFGSDSAVSVTVANPGARFVTDGKLSIGDSGQTNLSISDGAFVSAHASSLGANATGDARVDITGAGSMWTTATSLAVGGDTVRAAGRGDINIRSGATVQVGDQLIIWPTGTVRLNGGTLRTDELVVNGVFLWNSGTLQLTGLAGLTLGTGGVFGSTLTVGQNQSLVIDNTLTIQGGSVLSVLPGASLSCSNLSLLGGTVAAPGGINLDNVHTLTGRGLVGGAISGGATSTILATGTLTLGDLASSSGVDFKGTLNVASSQVLLLDADQAILSGQVILGDGGKLLAINGISLASGATLAATGNASVVGKFTSAGIVIGPAGAGQLLTFENDVTGPGLFTGNIHFANGITVTGNAPVSFNGDLTFTSGLILDGRTLTIGGNGHVLTTPSIAITIDGKLDLTSNGMIVQADPSQRDQVILDITDLVKRGRAGGAWTGPGITSSTAAAQPNKLTGLAVILNDNGLGLPILTTFGGHDADINSILIKYTWNGDMDLNGIIDADDYFLIDRGFANHLAGYRNGDLDFSGVVDADDYFLIDRAFVGQTGILSAGDPTNAAVVPEPGAGIFLVLAGVALSRRRRR
jgi:T5SS/PEP-CTERM-associated repeat protein